MFQIEEFAEGHNLRARRIGQSPRFKQGTAECIAQCEGDPLASRAQFRSKQIHNIVAGGEIENQIRGHVLVESFANCGISGHGFRASLILNSDTSDASVDFDLSDGIVVFDSLRWRQSGFVT